MPQMAPLWWSTLFIMFILCYLMTMMMSYYITSTEETSTEETIIEYKPMNWKW